MLRMHVVIVVVVACHATKKVEADMIFHFVTAPLAVATAGER